MGDLRQRPVSEALLAKMSFIVPLATISPPWVPARGPRSMMWSARRMVSSSCSTITRELPCLAKDSNRFDDFNTSRHYSIHVMGQDQQEQALRFARDGKDFSHAEWAHDPARRPQLSGCLARFDCQVHAQHDAGDHLIIVGAVQKVMYRTGKGLIFKRGQFGGFADLI